MSRVADIVIKTLLGLGVDRFFLVVGGNAMYLDEAIRETGVPYTCFHNEQAAAIAAEAYARVTGKIAVCVVTSGPGASNLVTGVAGAFLDSAPVLLIAGQAKSTELVTPEMQPGVRQYGTFELPMVQILHPITKCSYSMHGDDDPEEIVTRLAHLVLSGRPGPVFLEIPLDIQGATTQGQTEIFKLDFDYEAHHEVGSLELEAFCKDFLKDLANSKAPLILAGHGVRVAKAQDLLRKICISLNVPVVTTQIAKDVISYDDPYFIGHVGLRGDRPGNLALHEADLLLSMGCALQQQTVGYNAEAFAENSKKYVLDFEKSVSGKSSPFHIDRLLNTDLVTVLERILTLREMSPTDNSIHSEWVAGNVARKAALAVSLEPHDRSTTEINMYDFIFALGKLTKNEDTIVTDAGLCFYIMGQAYLLRKDQRYIVSGGLGAMGYAIPAAIGASLAGRRAICVTGDGSAQFNIQELATASANQSNAVFFVLNNGGYASIRNTQKSFFGPEHIGASHDSGVWMPQWDKIAQAYGIDYLLIENKESLIEGLTRSLQLHGPVFVEVICQKIQGLMPAVASQRNSDGILVSNPLHVMSPTLDTEEYLVHLN